MTDHVVTINGLNFAPYIERGQYTTSRTPVWSRTVTTTDGRDHKRLLRYRGGLKFKLNPLTDAQTPTVAAALAEQPAAVTYYDKDLGANVTRSMVFNGLTEQEIRWRFAGKTWNEPLTVTLTEL